MKFAFKIYDLNDDGYISNGELFKVLKKFRSYKKDFEKVGDFLHRVVQICLRVQKESGKKLVDFKKNIVNDEELKAICVEVNEFASKFPMPGVQL